SPAPPGCCCEWTKEWWPAGHETPRTLSERSRRIELSRTEYRGVTPAGRTRPRRLSVLLRQETGAVERRREAPGAPAGASGVGVDLDAPVGADGAAGLDADQPPGAARLGGEGVEGGAESVDQQAHDAVAFAPRNAAGVESRFHPRPGDLERA